MSDQPEALKPCPGTCCSCGYSGTGETECKSREDRTHCEHWWDGPEPPPLKPCAHCGEAKELQPSAKTVSTEDGCASGESWAIECLKCGARSGEFCTEEQAIEAWNRRVPAAESALVDAARARELLKWADHFVRHPHHMRNAAQADELVRELRLSAAALAATDAGTALGEPEERQHVYVHGVTCWCGEGSQDEGETDGTPERERLLALLREASTHAVTVRETTPRSYELRASLEVVTDYLLAHGVTLAPRPAGEPGLKEPKP